jgi:phospho-N-acetylmuramoyl-pentapeptide-transferase
MLYWLYERLAEHHHYVPVLNLLRYLTFRGGMAVATSQLVVVLMGSRFIRWMKAKQGKGQPIRADGIERHVIEKSGTPTMGGLMFLAGITVATLLWADLGNIYVWAVLLVTLGFGALGLMDDYAKVTKQSTAGISGRARLAVEAGLAMLAVYLMIRFAQSSPEGVGLSTSLAFPVFKRALLDLGWFYVPLGAFVVVGGANAVNFTDGLDGLATVPVMIAAATFGLIAYMVGNRVFAGYLELHFVPGAGELAVICAAIVGSGLYLSAEPWAPSPWPRSTRLSWRSSAACSLSKRCR